MDLLLLHLVIIVWLSVGAASRWTDHPSDRLLAAGALTWGNLLVTSLLLSPFSRLGDPSWFLAGSLGLAAATALSAWRFPVCPESHPDQKSAHGGLTFAVFLTLSPVALASFQAAANYLPTDPSSLSRSLPLALQQIGSGSILPLPAHEAWPAFHALNYGLLQVWTLACQPSLAALNYFNLIGWLAAGFAVHRLALVAGGSANSALAAGWCALMATPVLAQAITVGPELYAGAAMVAAASFSLDWAQRGRLASAAFAGLLAGLAAGSHPGALLLILALVPLGFVFRLMPRGHPGWKAALPGLGLGLLPSLVVNVSLLVQQGFGVWRPAWQRLADEVSGLGVATLLPLWQKPPPLQAPTEDAVGLGWTGLVCVAAAALSLGRNRWPGWPALAWLTACLIASQWIGLGSGALVPGILLAAPCVAGLLDRIPAPPRAWLLLGAGLAMGSLWSAHLYLWHNAYRPLAPLFDPTLAGRQHSPLPPQLAQRLREAPRVKLITDGDDRLLQALMGQSPPGPAVAGVGREDGAYTVYSRRAGTAGALDNLPDMPGGGVEYLGRMNLGPIRRDFFGLAAAALADTPSATPPSPSMSADPRPPPGFELVSAGDLPGVSCSGLLLAEGPFPQWNLPLIRWAKDETVTLRVRAGPGCTKLRLSFSARLYVRRRAVLEIACQGAPVRRLEFSDPAAWQDELIDLPAHPGENLIELRDVPLPPEPDWAAYLERYPDVKRYVEMMRQPPHEGAREHYELSGRAEGRIIRLVQPPRPEPGTHYYMFRSLRVEALPP